MIRKKKLSAGKQLLDSTGKTNNRNLDVKQSIPNQHGSTGHTEIKFEVYQSALSQHGGDEEQVEQVVNCSEDNQIASVKSNKHLCKFCHKVFRTKNVLTKHLEIHESESNHDSSSCIKTNMGIHPVSSCETILSNTSDALHSEVDIADDGAGSKSKQLPLTPSDNLIGNISKTSLGGSTVASDSSGYSCPDTKIPLPVARQQVVISDTSTSDDDRPTVVGNVLNVPAESCQVIT